MNNELIAEKTFWRRYGKWCLVLGGLLILFIAVVAYASVGLKASPQRQIRFDAEKWQFKKGLDNPHRINMLNDLLYSDTLRNASKTEILQLLGQPNQIDETYIFYTVAQRRIGRFPVNTKSLVIRLGAKGHKNKVMSHG